jgi:hypothetical protein
MDILNGFDLADHAQAEHCEHGTGNRDVVV